MKAIKSSLAASVLLALTPLTAYSEMPQDHWYFSGITILGDFGAIATGTDGNVYAATNGGTICTFADDGSFLRRFGSNLNVAGIATDSQTNIFVLDYTAAKRIKKFSSAGIELSSFGDAGSGFSQLNPGAGYSRITIDKNDRIYVADASNDRIQVYNANGEHLHQWTNSPADFGFGELSGITSSAAGGVFAMKNPGGVRPISQDGELLPSVVYLDGNSRASSVAVTPDGLFAFMRSDASRIEIFLPNDPSAVDKLFGIPFSPSQFRGICADRFSNLYVSADTSAGKLIFKLKRHFGHLQVATGVYIVDRAVNSSGVPIPVIEAVALRPGTTLIDVDYKVCDSDSSVVTTRMLAFRGGVGNSTESLAKSVILSAFVEGTSTNLGPEQPANVSRRVTWDASEANVAFDTFQFLVLANDARPMLDFRFVTLPDSESEPAFKISSSPVSDDRLLGLWFWLIASSDTSISFTNGLVKGLSGAYLGQTLASGRSTTALGRRFLYERLGVTNPTPNQLSRALSGNYGLVEVTENSVVKVP